MSAHHHIQKLRRETLEAKIEELIALLDVIDGETDLEEGGDIELDPAESGLADPEALDLFTVDSGITGGLNFDGSGREIARSMLQGIKVSCQSPRMRRRKA